LYHPFLKLTIYR